MAHEIHGQTDHSRRRASNHVPLSVASRYPIHFSAKSSLYPEQDPRDHLCNTTGFPSALEEKEENRLSVYVEFQHEELASRGEFVTLIYVHTLLSGFQRAPGLAEVSHVSLLRLYSGFYRNASSGEVDASVHLSITFLDLVGRSLLQGIAVHMDNGYRVVKFHDYVYATRLRSGYHHLDLDARWSLVRLTG